VRTVSHPVFTIAGLFAGALAGIVVGADKPALVVMHGGHWMVPAPSLAATLAYVAGGSALGVLAIFALGFAWAWACYRIRGDRAWKLVCPGFDGKEVLRVSLQSKVKFERPSLGDMECFVKTPAGATFSGQDVNPRLNPQGWTFRFVDVPRERGAYKARFYAAEKRLRHHEIARCKARITLPEDGLEHPASN
jgi:hypothetical protein